MRKPTCQAPIQVDLKKLDPATIEIRSASSFLHEFYLRLQQNEVFTSHPDIYEVGYFEVIIATDGNKLRQWDVLFVSENKPLAERVAKAWIHAIVLCGGGKAQPFLSDNPSANICCYRRGRRSSRRA